MIIVLVLNENFFPVTAAPSFGKLIRYPLIVVHEQIWRPPNRLGNISATLWLSGSREVMEAGIISNCFKSHRVENASFLIWTVLITSIYCGCPIPRHQSCLWSFVTHYYIRAFILTSPRLLSLQVEYYTKSFLLGTSRLAKNQCTVPNLSTLLPTAV